MELNGDENTITNCVCSHFNRVVKSHCPGGDLDLWKLDDARKNACASLVQRFQDTIRLGADEILTGSTSFFVKLLQPGDTGQINGHESHGLLPECFRMVECSWQFQLVLLVDEFEEIIRFRIPKICFVAVEAFLFDCFAGIAYGLQNRCPPLINRFANLREMLWAEVARTCHAV